jgi:hypothetical protein
MTKRLLLLAFAVGCSSSKGTGTTTVPPPAVACTDTAPCALTAGTAATGGIATAGQVDTYSIASTATSRTLLSLSLSMPAAATPVRLLLLLESGDGTKVLATRGPIAGAGPQSLGGNFLLPAAGTYRVVVRDAANSHADPHNTYSLTGTLLADPDASEPDDTPAQAQPIALTSALEQSTGYVASSQDVDLRSFTVTTGGLVEWMVSIAASSETLRLRARLLSRSAAAPNDLTAAVAVAEVDAPAAGAAVDSTLVRSLAAGSYLIAIDDVSSSESDPHAQWTTGIRTVPNPDPQEQNGVTNDTSATATVIAAGGSVQGAIGSQGDVDWYQISLPAETTPHILQIKLDPQLENQDVELSWAAGEALATPTGACTTACGPSDFCTAQKVCAYNLHALHHFSAGETRAQIVRLRHIGAAEVVRILVRDFGDAHWTADKLYAISTAYIADPDAHDTAALNDSLAAATQLTSTTDADGGVHASGGGTISSWDAIDGVAQVTNPKERTDVDWYEFNLPARTAFEHCLIPPPDAGPDFDAGLPDGGPCNPLPDGGSGFFPRPDYGINVHWQDPQDEAYGLRLIGKIAVQDGGSRACVFAFDQFRASASQLVVDSDGGITFGLSQNTCLCLPASNGTAINQMWVRIEPTAANGFPAVPNTYSDDPYAFSVSLNPGALQTACDGGCAAINTASNCPGE